MLRALVLPLGLLLVLAAQPSEAKGPSAKVPPYRAKIQPLSAEQRAQLKGRFWTRGCPVALSELRLLTVSHWGFDRRVRKGQLVVNRDVARPLATVFRTLYRIGFPIRHMRFTDFYGPGELWPEEGDVTGAFVCKKATPSPCSGGVGTGNWSQHAYGHAVDLNPIENPYFGPSCGRVYDRRSRPYLDRSRVRPGMVTPAVVRAFSAIGWGWGGYWSSTKDYMHFSASGG